MKFKAIILSFLFLLTGSGLKVEVATCCDAFSGISLHFKDNGFKDAKDCCACIKATKKSSCCHTQSYSTVINPVLGLQKVLTITHKDFSKNLKTIEYKKAPCVAFQNTNQISFGEFEQRTPTVPILIQKRVLQI